MVLNKNYLIFLIFILLTSNVFAQNVENQIENSVGNLEKNVTKIREFTDNNRWDFIGSQWKEFALKSESIVAINSFFTKINIVFVILFGMDWSLSMQMYFAFLFWISVIFLLFRWKVFSDKKWFRILYLVSGILLIPLTQIYEYVGKFAVSLVFYNGKLLWKFFFFVLITLFFITFNIIVDKFIALYKKIKENKEKKKEKENRKELDEVVKATRS